MKVNLNPENLVVAVQKSGSMGNHDHVEAIKNKTSVNAKKPIAARERLQPVVIDNILVNLRFNLDKETGIQVIQVIDAKSGELVRQIPAEELLKIAKALRDLKGLLVAKEL